MRRFVRIAAGIVLIAFASVKAMAQDPAPLDAATLRALGIASEPVPLASPGTPPRRVAPHAGAWSWTSGVYQYDGSGNVTAMGSQAFAYDTQGRLIAAKLTRPDLSGSIDHTYTYDDLGNMTARTESGSNPIQMPASVATNHLTSLSATYDAAGNVTQIQPPGSDYVYQYTFDALGAMQMAKVSNVSDETRQIHVYTAGDERIWTYDLGEGKSHWKIRDLGGNVLRDFEDDGTTWTVSLDYIYRDGLMLAAVTPTKTLHYSLDHLGSPRVITDGNRHRVGFHHYFPFGLEWLDSAGAQEGERKKFTGHERDRDPTGGLGGIDYMHARYYSPSIARFLSVDPTWESAGLGKPQSWNRYAYVMNDPINRVDPDGRCSALVGALTGPLCATFDAYEIARERAGDVAEAVSGMGPSVSTKENLMGVAVIGIVALDVGSSLMAPGEGAAVERGTSLAFKSFRAFKRMMGTAGSGMQWHHIVEQNKSNTVAFGKQALNSLTNLIKIDAKTHGKISGFYSSKIKGLTGNLTVREWLAKKSYKEQYEFGMKVLRDFGVTR